MDSTGDAKFGISPELRKKFGMVYQEVSDIFESHELTVVEAYVFLNTYRKMLLDKVPEIKAREPQ